MRNHYIFYKYIHVQALHIEYHNMVIQGDLPCLGEKRWKAEEIVVGYRQRIPHRETKTLIIDQTKNL